MGWCFSLLIKDELLVCGALVVSFCFGMGCFAVMGV